MGFLNITALFGLFGMVIPILIHLFARHKRQKILFSSTAFLKQIQSSTLRKLKLRQWILLLLRTIAIGFFVLAFARPTLKTASGIIPGQAGSSMALVVDRSMSMARDHLFEEAKKRSGQVLDLLGAGDEANLLYTFPPDGIPLSNSSRILRDLAQQSVSWGEADIPGAVRRAAGILESSRQINREIYVISDMQASNITGKDSTVAWDGRLYFICLEGEKDNPALISGGISSRLLQTGTPIEGYAVIKNFGERRLSGIPLRVTVDGSAAVQKTVDLEPDETERISFQFRPHRAGWSWGEIGLVDDGFIQDDRLYFTFYIPEEISVLLVGNTGEDIIPLEWALLPVRNAQGTFRTTKAFREDWIQLLPQMQVVMFSNFPFPAAGEAERLISFVEDGGGVFFLSGSRVDIRQWNEAFFKRFELVLGNVTGGSGYQSIDTFDYGHPLFSGVFEPGKGSVQSPRFFRLVEIAGKTSNRIITLTHGPLLIEERLGRGRLLLAASGIESSWSDLAGSTLFAPLIYRSASYLGAANTEIESFTVGSELQFSGRLDDLKASYRVSLPSGEEIQIIPEAAEGRLLLRLKRTEEPGIYRFFKGNNLLGMRAVNPPVSESDFTAVSEEDLVRVFPKSIVGIIRDDPMDAVVASRWGQELWQAFLIMGLIALVLEMIIAREGKSALSQQIKR